VRRRLGCGHHCWRVPGKKLARHSHGRASAARRFGTLAAAASLVHATRRARSCTPTAWTTRDCWWSAPKSCAACLAWRAQRGGGSERVQKQHAATVQTHADGCYSHKHVLVAHASAPAVTTSQALRAPAPQALCNPSRSGLDKGTAKHVCAPAYLPTCMRLRCMHRCPERCHTLFPFCIYSCSV